MGCGGRALCLCHFTYCRVRDVFDADLETLLVLEPLEGGQKSEQECKQPVSCALADGWRCVRLSAGDAVSVQAAGSGAGPFRVSAESGLLVLEPNQLVTGSALMVSLQCLRRSALQDRFKPASDSSPCLVLGQLVHRACQESLVQHAVDLGRVRGILTTLRRDKAVLDQMLACGMSDAALTEQLDEYAPRIAEFARRFVQADVVDIEECLSAPHLGLKGSIDVTLRMADGCVPLELKTGQVSVSAAHRGQVIVYQMLLHQLDADKHTGLLYYLKEGRQIEVRPSAVDTRDILASRNEMVYYRRRGMACGDLPPPTANTRVCTYCPVAKVCVALGPDKSHINAAAHLSAAHLAYFRHWLGLIHLENVHSEANAPAFWRTAVEQRLLGRKCCRCRLEAVEKVAGKSMYKYLHEFRLGQSFNVKEGDYVVVSCEEPERLAIASGLACGNVGSHWTALLDRNLGVRFCGQDLLLDVVDRSTKISAAFLTALMADSPRAEQLRHLVIDLQPPTQPDTTEEELLAVLDHYECFAHLNAEQREAVQRVATCASGYSLVQGLPGTGKTETIVAMVRVLVRLRRRVLVTSFTHSALDNVCSKLNRWALPYLRLGEDYRVAPEAVHRAEARQTDGCNTVKQLAAVYGQTPVVLVTCNSSMHPAISGQQFDVCIVDEAALIMQFYVMPGLLTADTFVLVGDTMQLRPLVRSPAAAAAGMAESLQHRLAAAGTGANITLTAQYRMNQRLTDVANRIVYCGQLECRAAGRSLPSTGGEARRWPQWLRTCLSPHPADAFVVLDTGPQAELQGANQPEAELVARLVRRMLASRLEVGVMALYKAQAALIAQLLESNAQDVLVGTVDHFQGLDRDICIFSCVKSRRPKAKWQPSEEEILQDKRRLAVALTRAKLKLILVGDVETLKCYKTMAEIIDCDLVCVVKAEMLQVEDEAL